MQNDEDLAYAFASQEESLVAQLSTGGYPKGTEVLRVAAGL